ncbi:hypothetical protein T484DRAFT_1965043, partial [Baffinella frigidus]
MWTLTGHSERVDQVEFSDDGAQAISGSIDGTVRGPWTREGPGGMCVSVPGMAEQDENLGGLRRCASGTSRPARRCARSVSGTLSSPRAYM